MQFARCGAEINVIAQADFSFYPIGCKQAFASRLLRKIPDSFESGICCTWRQIRTDELWVKRKRNDFCLLLYYVIIQDFAISLIFRLSHSERGFPRKSFLHSARGLVIATYLVRGRVYTSFHCHKDRSRSCLLLVHVGSYLEQSQLLAGKVFGMKMWFD